MARQLRLDAPGCFWHVTSRGNAKADIVHDDHDRHCFLELLGKTVGRFKWVLYAYALMTNHFHLALETTEPTLSPGMQWLSGAYARAFNKRHDRVGHLFQGRFKAFLIDKEMYFLEVLRYVVLNPVRAGMVASVADYPWTSYRATAGDEPAPSWLASDRALAMFGDDKELARERYKRLVEEGVGAPTPWRNVVAQTYLGGKEWVEQTQWRLASALRSADHPRKQRDLRDIRMADVVTAVSAAEAMPRAVLRHSRGGRARMIAAWIGVFEAQRPLREIAAALNLRSEGHVSELVSRCDRLLQSDPALQQATAAAVRIFSSWRNRKPKM
jgi:REP element-mobilizing transposase RayT